MRSVHFHTPVQSKQNQHIRSISNSTLRSRPKSLLTLTTSRLLKTTLRGQFRNWCQIYMTKSSYFSMSFYLQEMVSLPLSLWGLGWYFNDSLHLDQGIWTYGQCGRSSQQPSLRRCSIMWVVVPSGKRLYDSDSICKVGIRSGSTSISNLLKMSPVPHSSSAFSLHFYARKYVRCLIVSLAQDGYDPKCSKLPHIETVSTIRRCVENPRSSHCSPSHREGRKRDGKTGRLQVYSCFQWVTCYHF